MSVAMVTRCTQQGEMGSIDCMTGVMINSFYSIAAKYVCNHGNRFEYIDFTKAATLTMKVLLK